MNWIKQLKKKRMSRDTSPALKRGEFKKMLMEEMEALPDFDFLHHKGGTYHFGRVRNFNQYPVYEGIHINFSLKEGVINGSVSSNFNPTYRFTNSYHTGILNSHHDLLSLKRGAGITQDPAAAYFHNGQVDTTKRTIAQLVNDLLKVGLSFFDKRSLAFRSNQLLPTGLAFTDQLSSPKDELRAAFEQEMREVKFEITRIKHPLYLELKQSLQALSDQPRELRQQIPGLAFSLIELYYQS